MMDGDLAVNVEAKDKNNVTSLPTLVFFRSGYGISKQEGFQSAMSIEQWVNAVAGPEENQAAFDKALKKRETHEVVFAAIGGPKLKD
eukprot:g1889.t1